MWHTATGSLRLPSCPVVAFQLRGERFGEPARLVHATDEDSFREGVYAHLKVEVAFVNALPDASVRLNWINGGYVKPMFELGAAEARDYTVYLGHTLHAEHTSRKGATISDNSSLLVYTVREMAG